MPRWSPYPMWQGEDAYVIGGGASLRDFDWRLIREANTIGCNGAYALGGVVCKILLFGDVLWWEKIGRRGTENFGGIVVGTTPKLIRDNCPWLLTMDRCNTVGFDTKKLGFPGNTGGAAINLALILGARRVFLLGFDMKLKDHQANWHNIRYEPAVASVYPGFCRELARMAHNLHEVFPNVEVINVTDDSELDVYPKVGVGEHFNLKEVVV